MKPEIKAQWVAALRSGDYKQGTGRLKDRDGEYCCLGVLCELAVEAGVISKSFGLYGSTLFDECDVSLSDSVMKWSGVHTPEGRVPGMAVGDFSSLTRLNDNGTSFSKIADIIEEHF